MKNNQMMTGSSKKYQKKRYPKRRKKVANKHERNGTGPNSKRS